MINLASLKRTGVLRSPTEAKEITTMQFGPEGRSLVACVVNSPPGSALSSPQAGTGDINLLYWNLEKYHVGIMYTYE